MRAAAGGPPPPELPPPASGLFLEVSFRRLLASCEDIAGGTSTSRPDLVDCWQRSPVFHHYVEAIQEQLADLEASAGTRLQRSTLELYADRVEALALRLQPADLPAFCSGVAPQPGAAAALQQPQVQPAQQASPQQLEPQPAEEDRQRQQHQQQGAAIGQAARGAQAAAAAATMPSRLAVPAPPVAVARTPQLPAKPVGVAGAQQQSAAAAAAAAAAAHQPARAGGAGAAPVAAGTTSGHLQTQQQLHEDLTEELAGLAAQLKSNTQAIEGRLRGRGQLLDSTEAALDTSVQRTKESKERATRVHRRGRTNFCLTCLVMFIIGLAFAAMYVFIKVTRLAGYRAPVPVPAAAPAPAASELAPPDGVPEYEEHYAEL